ncbi:MAG: molybdopterin oxidoreductase family protein, partial [Epsilonproteobacteria bacterium]|nr:molybdopterin oxidoreductase family protein [Campylobacterota bacterium]
RLLWPQTRPNLSMPFVKSSWDEALGLIVKALANTDPKRVGFYLSGQMSTEDYYVANKLGKGFLGTANVDTNSRTCMASAVMAYKKTLGADYVPVRMEDIEKADLLFVVGANPAEAHVVFWRRVQKARKRGLKVVVADPRFTDTAQGADLYLPLRPNSDIDLFNLIALRLIRQNRVNRTFIARHVQGYEDYRRGILALDERALLAQTGLDETAFEAFFNLLIQSHNFISAWTMGLNQSAQGTDKNLALLALHLLTGTINRPGNGPLSLTGQPNAMGGREVGGLATTLAAHLDFTPENVAKVSRFWRSDRVAAQPGLTAFEMIESAERGEMDVLIVCHTDPVYHLPNRNRVEKAMRKIPLVVEINAYEGSETAPFAHIRLPAAPWGEKEGTQTNLDRTVSRLRPLYPYSGKARADWEIFADIGRRLGFEEAFAFRSAKEVFDEYRTMTRLSPRKHLNLFASNYDTLNERPFVWGEGALANNRFLTPTGKAHIHFVTNRHLSEMPDDTYPFILLTGRTRDQWHSGTKTAAIQRLLQHKPLTFVEIHTEDAKRLGIQEGDQVDVTSRRGRVTTIAKVTEHIRRGVLFMPVTDRHVNYLTHDLLDADAKEPDYNHAAVAIRKV